MTKLSDLIDRLNERHVMVAWAQHLRVPGLWVSRHCLLVLSAAHEDDDLGRACRDVLTLLDQPRAPQSSPRHR